MKKLGIIVFSSCLLAACLNTTDKEKNGNTKSASANQPAASSSTEDPATYTSIQWLDSIRNMGTINEGQSLEVSFRFKNMGDKPLVIRSVRASCGCTTPNPPTKPFAPGEEGEIKATFDSKNRVGPNNKTIYVSTNTKGKQTFELSFSVDVIKAKE